MLWKNVEIGLYVMINGMGVVFISLVILMGFIRFIGWAERTVGRLRKKIEVASLYQEISPEEVAVIAAAVTHALSAKIEIHHIRLLHDYNQEAWSTAGRMAVMHSHNLQTPNK